MSDLKGKVVVITGATSGIGRETALAAGSHGAKVVLAARRNDRLVEISTQIAASGGSALPVQTDVTEEAQIDHLFAAILEMWNRIDVFVNNAGSGLHASIEETTPAQMDRLWKNNFLSTFHCVRKCVAIMKQQKSGHIITVSSMAGRRGTPMSGAYCATKFAQVGFMDSLRRELEGTGVRSTVIYPGPTKTEFLERMENPNGAALHQYGQVQTASEVAEAIIRAIREPTPEVITQKFGRILLLMNALSPALVDKLVNKTLRRKK